MRAIRKLLVANRGEIALRILRTCRSMGIATVAVASDADVGAPFARAADEAIRIGPPPVAESYLSVERLLNAARRTGADAVHPGYGFLSENADFAEAVAAAGLIFVGPPADAIRVMGSKREAKARMTAAGVPVIPGGVGEDHDTDALVAQIRALGLPALIKASAGGGGKGMRLVRSDRGLAAEVDAARREAEKAFGDGTLLVERYIEQPRHVEIQVFGDAHGNVVHLFERECSIQRRHQKIIEETPSPALDPALRARMGAAAVAAAREIGYQSAGTVEFVLGPDGAVYFLEVNTRLQVEHAITECVAGLDLVRLQIEVAEGRPLPFSQEDLVARGAAIECRLYAESPARGFLPSTGTLVDWHLPLLDGVRVDAGVESGMEIGIHYDPLLAKVVASGADRPEALRRMESALRALSALGVETNREFLLAVLQNADFQAGRYDTHFIEDHVLDTEPSAGTVRDALAAATVAAWASRRAERTILPGLVTGWRADADARQEMAWDRGQVAYRDQGNGTLRLWQDDVERSAVFVGQDGPALDLELDGLRRRYRVVSGVDGRVYVHTRAGAVALQPLPRFPREAEAEETGACVAPMPGKVLAVHVAVGDTVTRGQTVITLEAMKMEHAVDAPADAVVAELLVAPGDQVEVDALLVRFGVLDG